MECWGKSVWKCDSSSFVHEWMHALRRSCPPWHRSLAESRMEVDIRYCNIYPVMLILTHTHRYINNICVVCVYALIHKRFTFTCFHLLSPPWPSKTSHGQPLTSRKSWFRRAFVTYVAGEPSSPFVQMATELIKSEAWIPWSWMGHVYDPRPLCILYDFIISCLLNLMAHLFFLSKVVGWILLHNTS